MTVSGCTRGMLAKSAWMGALVTVIAMTAGTGASGCDDPDGAFNDFVDRSNKLVQDSGSDVVQETGECLPITQSDVEGGYLFTLAANILPSVPFVANATVTIDEGARTLSFSLQPLDADDDTTPVGAPIVGGPFAIEDDGSFVADFGVVTMDGAANPISGSTLVTELVLTASPGGWCANSTFVCGAVSGIASEPIKDLDLVGSTFTFQKLTAPGVYPELVTDCAGTIGK